MDNVLAFPPFPDAPPPPHNIEAEQQLLGAILVNNEAFHAVADIVREDDFFESAHRRVWRALAALINRDQLVTAVTLKTYLEQDAGLAEVGGAAYLARLAGASAGMLNVSHYAATVRDLAVRRRVMSTAQSISTAARDASPESTSDDLLDQFDAAITDLRKGEPGIGPRPIITFVDEALDSVEQAILDPSRPMGISTGLASLDAKTGGLRASQFIIVAGRPGMGKTSFALSLAKSAALAGAGVLFSSLEMKGKELAIRLITDLAWTLADPIDYERAERGFINPDQARRLYEARQHAATLPLWIDDRGDRTMPAIRSTAKMVAAEFAAHGTPLGLIIVDHIGLVLDSGRQRDKVNQVAEISRALKMLAKAMDVPVVGLCQLNRAVEQRDNKRPTKADLRDSGAIEQDADVVLFPFREVEYLARAEPEPRTTAHLDWEANMAACRRVVEIDVAKQRQGPIGSITVHCDIGANAFRDLRGN